MESLASLWSAAVKQNGFISKGLQIRRCSKFSRLTQELISMRRFKKIPLIRGSSPTALGWKERSEQHMASLHVLLR